MYRIFLGFRLWLDALLARPRDTDPLDELSIRQFADLPPVHPRCETC